MQDVRSRDESARASRWPLAAIGLVLIAAGACKEDRKGGTPATENQSTCSKDEECKGRQVCASNPDDEDPSKGGLPSLAKSCICVVGQRGATCAFDTDCGPAGSGRTCSPTECQCTGPGTDPGDGGGGGGGGGDGGEEPGGAGSCARECTTDADCPSSEDVCKNGKCYNGCKTKGCSRPGTTCVEVNGQARCVVACTGDADCNGVAPCASQADDGSKFCATACTTDQDCADPDGEGHRGPHCVNGTCACKADSECKDHVNATRCAN